MAADRRDPNGDDGSTEFGLGSGLIDQVARKDRNITAEDELREIYSRPKTFDGSALGLPGGVRPALEDTPVPRLLPGETEADRS